MPAYNDDGQWRWRKLLRLTDGTKKRGSGTAPVNTKKSAEEAERAWIARVEAGAPKVRAESPTLQSIADGYLSHIGMHRSPSLRANRGSTFKAHILPWFGRMRLDKITSVEIDAFKAHQLSEDVGLAPGTVNNHVMSLTNLLRWSRRRGLLDALPEVDMLPRKHKSDVEHLEDDEVAALLANEALVGQLRAMVMVALDTGVRAGELLALQWGDVDLKRGRVRVQRGTYRGIDRATKTGHARTIPLTKRVQAVFASERHELSDLVFCDVAGGGIPYATALWRLQDVTELGGWHVLRHTFATRLASRGVPLKAIMEWMGHSSIKTTMIYAHYSPVLDSAIQVLESDSWQPSANQSPASGKDQ